MLSKNELISASASSGMKCPHGKALTTALTATPRQAARQSNREAITPAWPHRASNGIINTWPAA